MAIPRSDLLSSLNLGMAAAERGRVPPRSNLWHHFSNVDRVNLMGILSESDDDIVK